MSPDARQALLEELTTDRAAAAIRVDLYMTTFGNPTQEQIVFLRQTRVLNPGEYGCSILHRNFELDGTAGFRLHHDGPR
jgi:hypothetical protein